MSAFLCSADHLSALVNAASLAQYMNAAAVEACLSPESKTALREGFLGTPKTTIQSVLYADLLKTNLDSLASRYPSDTPSSWTDGDDYRYSTTPAYRTALEAIKGAECYRYQSSEHEGWETSGANLYINRLISNLIGELPGYDQAAWGYEPKKVAGGTPPSLKRLVG